MFWHERFLFRLPGPSKAVSFLIELDLRNQDVVGSKSRTLHVLEALQKRRKDLGSLFLANQLEVDDLAPCCLAE